MGDACAYKLELARVHTCVSLVVSFKIDMCATTSVAKLRAPVGWRAHMPLNYK